MYFNYVQVLECTSSMYSVLECISIMYTVLECTSFMYSVLECTSIVYMGLKCMVLEVLNTVLKRMPCIVKYTGVEVHYID